MNNIINHHSCGVVLYRDVDGEKLFLLLNYPAGHVDLPKGHIEEGESLKECAQRELQEETGIDQIEFIDGFKDVLSYYYQQDGAKHYKKVDFFLAKTEISDVVISHEHTGFAWLPFDQAMTKLTYDGARSILNSAKSFLDTIQV